MLRWLSRGSCWMFTWGLHFLICMRNVGKWIMKNTVSWNSMITCYEQNGPASEALELFVKMMECGVHHVEMTLASIVSACSSLCAVKEGQAIHARVVKLDKLCDDLVISNALVDMYAKCRKIKEARWIFDRMPIRNVVSETSMVSGYAKSASVETARSMFSKMIERNVVSWNALIAGLVEEGYRYFDSMRKDYGIEPLKDQYTCMVDLLGRNGRLAEAKNLILSMPMPPDGVVLQLVKFTVRSS